MARPHVLALLVLSALAWVATPASGADGTDFRAAETKMARKRPIPAHPWRAHDAIDDFGNMEVRDSTGQVVPQSTVGLDYGFQGRRLDPETGLMYFRARMYDPATGRFIQRDPVWDPVSMGNQYTAFGNNPATNMDPTGEIA